MSDKKVIDDNTRIVFEVEILFGADFSQYKLQRKRNFLWWKYWKTTAKTYHSLHSDYNTMYEFLLWKENYKITSIKTKIKDQAFYECK